MFQFESLELLYWDCWERFKIPLDAKIIAVTGPNGSGKTTLLDALRTLLATQVSQKRDYKKYARRPNKPHSWILGVVTNGSKEGGRRPFFPMMSDRVTLACHINKKGGDWQRSYFILPGTVSLEEIIRLSENPPDPFYKPKGVREYQTELERAGLSDAMLTVLSLEQGATDKLCECSSQELLRLVYAAFGDKPTLDNYERAIQEQTELEKELEEMRGRVARLENQRTALTNRMNNYREYEALTMQRATLNTETLAQADYVETSDQIKGASGNIIGLRKEVLQLEEKERSLTDEESKIAEEEKRLAAALKKKEVALIEIQTAFVAANRESSAIDTQLGEIGKLRDVCKGIEPMLLEPLQKKHKALLKEEFSLGQKRAEIALRLQALYDEKKALLTSRLSLDRPIAQFHQRLQEANLFHTFLYENIEVIEERWRVAVESILRGYRFVILLKNPSDRWRAWEMGEKEGYRHFVVGERGKVDIATPPGSLLEVVRLSEEVPEWVRRLLAEIRRVRQVEEGKRLPEGVTFITEKGYIRERRGGRSVAVDGADFAFGEAGRKKRLALLEKEVEEKEAESKRLEAKEREINTTMSALGQEIERQESLQRYLSRKGEEERLQDALRMVIGRITDLEEKMKISSQEKGGLEENRLSAAKEWTAVQKDLEQTRENLMRQKESLSTQRRERIERYKGLRQQRIDMPETWRLSEALSKYREAFNGVREVQREIDKVESRLQRGEWEKDPAVILLKEKVEQDYQGEHSNLERKEKELSETRRVTEEARSAYIDYLRASIRFYEKNLKRLAGLANVDIEVEKPHLENDDFILKEAGLAVKWNFDKKGFTETDDGEGSGGQQVIKSLILLIALLLAEGESGGFVFIDEPFAHLDVMNIDRVAEFLVATQTQYVITSPITHNTNVYRPAFLTLVTRTKRSDRPFADPPAHIRRMESPA